MTSYCMNGAAANVAARVSEQVGDGRCRFGGGAGRGLRLPGLAHERGTRDPLDLVRLPRASHLRLPEHVGVHGRQRGLGDGRARRGPRAVSFGFRLEAPALRVRGGEAPHRHPGRRRRASQGPGIRKAPGGHCPRLGEAARGVRARAREVSPVRMRAIVLAAGKADIEHVKPMFPNGLTGIGGAIAIIYVSFFGYQLIANTAEEIINSSCVRFLENGTIGQIIEKPSAEALADIPTELSHDIAKRIRDAAEMGDVTTLNAIAAEIKDQSDSCMLFSKQIIQMAEDFDLDGI